MYSKKYKIKYMKKTEKLKSTDKKTNLWNNKNEKAEIH